MKNAPLETLVWLLIYGGLALLMVGLWSIAALPALGGVLVAAGAIAAVAGALLIWWRSRRPDDLPPPGP